MRTLAVLMWKHCTVRRRRFINTPIEWFLPLIFFIILFMIRHFFMDVLSEAVANKQAELFGGSLPEDVARRTNIHNTEPFQLDHNPPPTTVVYYPHTKLSGILMDEVGRQLGLVRMPFFTDTSNGYYYGLLPNSTDDVASIVKKMGDDEAIVIFEPMGEEWPRRLNYTIRMKTDFMTHLYEPLDEKIKPHERFGALYEPFMRLQWAIDSSYLRLVSGKPIDQTIWVQEFPFADSMSQNELLIEMIAGLLPQLCMLSLVLPFVFLMARLMEERASGVQELIKMIGVSQCTLNISHFLNTVPAGLIYSIGGAILLTVSSTPIVAHTYPFIIFVALALHYTSVVALAAACSYISQSNQYATSLSVLALIVSWIPARLLGESKSMPRFLRLLTGLFPHVPIYWVWLEVSTVERIGKGITFSSMVTHHATKSGSVLQAYVFLIAQSALLFVIGWYLGHVRPGKYGVARPWNFLWHKNNRKVTQSQEDEAEEPITRDPQYFEPLPPHADVGIQIMNVSKVFGKNKALSNVSFDVLKGEITVLLGHNGAGKTTLMSIITGMFSATEGRILVNGLDTRTHQTAVRKQLGLCTQHNLFFDDLSVKEHVRFFAMLKGQSYREAGINAHEILEKLSLDNKEKSKPSQLSGGMKRRLQLACALSGGADVLVLDEPTSGLDVETRRELWDLLLSLRGSRTVLLTTHFMEEADALGDRVAALHAGTLRCHATPMFLKKTIGTGYRLSLTTVGIPKEPQITKVVTRHVHDAALKEKSLNTVSYTLPAQDSPKFPRLFADLESKRPELGINSIGVGVSTLEEVFLRLCSNVETTFSQDATDGAAPESTYEKLTGIKLCFSRFKVLMFRHLKYLWSKKFNFAILQIIVPIILIFAFTSLIQSDDDTNTQNKNSDVALNLDMYGDKFDKKVMYNVEEKNILRSVSEKYPKVKFEESPNVASAVLRTGIQDLLDYNKYIAGVELNDTDAKVLYTTTVRHAAPVALNLVSNMIAARSLPWADGRTITTHNYPLQNDKELIPLAANKPMKEPKDRVTAGTWTVFMVFIILNTAMGCTSLLCSERATGARHLHIMAGCPPVLHWASTVIMYTVLYGIILVGTSLIACKVMEKDNTIDRGDFLGALFVVLMLGLMAFLAFAFLLTFWLKERATGFVLLVVVLVLGALPALVKTPADIFETNLKMYKYPLSVLRYTIPANTLTSGIFYTTNVAIVRAYCDLNVDKCPNIQPALLFNVTKCCITKEPQYCYFCLEPFAPGKDMLILLCQFLFYMTLVMLAQHGIFCGLIDKVLNAGYKPLPPKYDDEMVRAEKTYVRKANSLPTNQIGDAMLVDDLHKMYRPCFKKIRAVQGISFSVKKGECFGILGVNGAGKSTTFKMITGEECATRGSITANNHRLKCPREKYLQSLGYCPQFFGLDMFMTGRENLTTMLTLRGFAAHDVAKEVKSWIAVVGLEKYTDIPVRSYSGGCMRRLATAAALCGGSPTTLLDEPTSGVDVGARRRVWAAMRRAMAAQRSIIITSHSMDEMEALCSRIGIMSHGCLGALGSPAALRAAHAAGHAVVIKLTTVSTDVTDGHELQGVDPSVQALKAQLHQHFNCSLKDEHKTMLHYHINETMRYSELFAQLEELKQAFPNLIEDYSVTETTLEEVFLSFAQDSDNPGHKHRV